MPPAAPPKPADGAPVWVLALVYATPGRATDVARVEDQLLAVAGRHGCRVLTRSGAAPVAASRRGARLPDEVHVLEFPDRATIDAYLADPARAAVDAGGAIERVEAMVLAPQPPT